MATSATGMTAITVIVCTWNRAAQLEQTLSSLAMQTGIDSHQVEVIVVDNNSTDETKVVVERRSENWPLGKLRYEFEARQGKQFALNRGVLASASPVLAFTDDDILLAADWLQRVRQLFMDESLMLAGGKTLIAWGPRGRPPWFADDMLAILGDVNQGDIRLDPAPQNYAPAGANLIARRSLFDRVGLFSETHFRHMDHEFGMRCHSRGIRLVYEPLLVVRAPVDEQCLTLRYFRRWSFKAGIARSGGIEAPDRPTVPRWVYRQFVQDMLAVALSAPMPRTPTRFARELRMWRAWGTIANAWHAWMHPRRHRSWVMRHSQKKKGLY